MPRLRGSEKRAFGELWRYAEARARRDIHPAWRPIPNWALRSWRISQPNFCLAGAREVGAFWFGWWKRERGPHCKQVSGHYPAGQRGLLPMLRETGPYRCTSAICGWRALPSQRAGDLVVERARTLGRSLLCGFTGRQGLWLPAHRLGLGCPVPRSQRSPLFGGTFSTVQDSNPVVSPPPIQEEIEKDPNPKVCPSQGVTAPSEDLLSRRRLPEIQRSPLDPAPRPPVWAIPSSHQDLTEVILNSEAETTSMTQDSQCPPHSRESASQPRCRRRTCTPRPVPAAPSPVPQDMPSDSPDHHRASQQRGGFRDLPPQQGPPPAPDVHPTTPPSPWNYDWNRRWREA